jgi:hypothetical protein
MIDFRKWLLTSIDKLDHSYNVDAAGEWSGYLAGTIAADAANMAARLGLAELHEASRKYRAWCDVLVAKTFLAQCLAAVPEPKPSLSDPPAMMTEAETIAYLRLDVDERNPAERLRNLVRRQRLPCVRRGRLILYRRAAVDAWLEKRK